MQGGATPLIRMVWFSENKKRLQELGVKNIVQSLTSLTHSQTLKKNCHAGDADYIPDSGDDVQVGKVLYPKRVANLRKLCRVFASNNTQEVPSTSNATKQTLSETIEGNKRRAKRRTVLNDEDDDIFEEGNRVDMELDDFHHDYEYENMDDTLHTNNRIDAQMIDHDNLQQQIQHLDNEKATGAPKKVRSHTQKARIWKMVSNERILVMFNKFGKPMGDECKELVQYLGTLVRMPEHVSIEYSDWRKAPMQQKEYMYSLVKNTCAKKRSSRSKMKEPHVTGTKSFARLAHEVAMKNDGVYPTRGEMYIKTRTRKDGSVVDDEAASVVTSLKAITSDSTITPRDRDDFTRDDYSKVKGPEKRGYVRLVGRMPATKDEGDFASNSQTIHQLQSVVNVMKNIIHEHIPNANLSSVLSDMNIQV
ncbi:hypothetical protein R6Q59_035410 [Mikania micrantha]